MNPTLRRLAMPLILLVFWQIVASQKLVDPFFFPPPLKIFQALVKLFTHENLLGQIGISLGRATLGFALATVAGLTLGLAIAASRVLEDLLDPLIEYIRPISTFALVPVLIVWFGIGETSKVLLIFKSCFFPIALNTIAGIKGVDGKLILAARSFGARGWFLWRQVLIPAAMPTICTGLRISIGMAMLSIVGVEMLSSDSGLGYLVIDSQRIFATDKMFAGIVIISVIGYSLDRAAKSVEAVALSWHKRASLEGGRS
ncbi:Putative aliphatic sulfonates transport permease protein SsuC [Fundidesulfovibrio magnetotacticus]|uniref:Aliphatic sulfonates transport permease protein SsuC n=1 Tax=Fundidesulfovibrio magnetotacticus TaxID=2730080 RepID=A0A6V8LRG1_9BACT|nr:ABC transporter permease [Fundidesulfovibrio magnetotacticus]GFK92366.1 Putative aliphatic sulfonates transport permease protein SsuC [Fundidesulfovibrio magnetotacticus]